MYSRTFVEIIAAKNRGKKTHTILNYCKLQSKSRLAQLSDYHIKSVEGLLSNSTSGILHFDILNSFHILLPTLLWLQ